MATRVNNDIHRVTSRSIRISLEQGGAFTIIPGMETAYLINQILCVPPNGDEPPGSKNRIYVPGDIVAYVQYCREFTASAQILVDQWWMRAKPERLKAIQGLDRLIRYMPFLTVKMKENIRTEKINERQSLLIGSVLDSVMKTYQQIMSDGVGINPPIRVAPMAQLELRWEPLGYGSGRDPETTMLQDVFVDLQYQEVTRVP